VSGNSVVLEIEGFLYDADIMDVHDSASEQMTDEVTTAVSRVLGLAVNVLIVVDQQELLEAVDVFINDCQVVAE
jgi:hypothetical protein